MWKSPYSQDTNTDYSGNSELLFSLDHFDTRILGTLALQLRSTRAGRQQSGCPEKVPLRPEGGNYSERLVVQPPPRCRRVLTDEEYDRISSQSVNAS